MVRACDDDRQGAGGGPGACSPSDPGPDQATSAAPAADNADNLVEAVTDLLDILVEAPEDDADPS